jgi:xanthine dehydrogenase YagT iron-sulfur-binding subunit
MPVRLNVNGHDYDLMLEPRVTLLDALREYIGLAGTKKGCDRGQCGACTVLVNDRRINACLALAIAHTGDRIRTIEGLAEGASLHPCRPRSSSTTDSSAAIARRGKSARLSQCSPRCVRAR